MDNSVDFDFPNFSFSAFQHFPFAPLLLPAVWLVLFFAGVYAGI